MNSGNSANVYNNTLGGNQDYYKELYNVPSTAVSQYVSASISITKSLTTYYQTSNQVISTSASTNQISTFISSQTYLMTLDVLSQITSINAGLLYVNLYPK